MTGMGRDALEAIRAACPALANMHEYVINDIFTRGSPAWSSSRARSRTVANVITDAAPNVRRLRREQHDIREVDIRAVTGHQRLRDRICEQHRQSDAERSLIHAGPGASFEQTKTEGN